MSIQREHRPVILQTHCSNSRFEIQPSIEEFMAKCNFCDFSPIDTNWKFCPNCNSRITFMKQSNDYQNPIIADSAIVGDVTVNDAKAIANVAIDAYIRGVNHKNDNSVSYESEIPLSKPQLDTPEPRIINKNKNPINVSDTIIENHSKVNTSTVQTNKQDIYDLSTIDKTNKSEYPPKGVEMTHTVKYHFIKNLFQFSKNMSCNTILIFLQQDLIFAKGINEFHTGLFEMSNNKENTWRNTSRNGCWRVDVNQIYEEISQNNYHEEQFRIIRFNDEITLCFNNVFFSYSKNVDVIPNLPTVDPETPIISIDYDEFGKIIQDWIPRINLNESTGRHLCFNISKNGLFIGGRVQQDLEWKFFETAEYNWDNDGSVHHRFLGQNVYKSSYSDNLVNPFSELEKVRLISIAFGNQFPLVVHCLGESLNLIGYIAPRIGDI